MSHILYHPDPDEALQSFAVQFREQLRAEIIRIGSGGKKIVAAHLDVTERTIGNHLNGIGHVEFKTLYLAVKNLGFLFEHDGVIFGRME